MLTEPGLLYCNLLIWLGSEMPGPYYFHKKTSPADINHHSASRWTSLSVNFCLCERLAARYQTSSQRAGEGKGCGVIFRDPCHSFLPRCPSDSLRKKTNSERRQRSGRLSGCLADMPTASRGGLMRLLSSSQVSDRSVCPWHECVKRIAERGCFQRAY